MKVHKLMQAVIVDRALEAIHRAMNFVGREGMRSLYTARKLLQKRTITVDEANPSIRCADTAWRVFHRRPRHGRVWMAVLTALTVKLYDVRHISHGVTWVFITEYMNQGYRYGAITREYTHPAEVRAACIAELEDLFRPFHLSALKRYAATKHPAGASIVDLLLLAQPQETITLEVIDGEAARIRSAAALAASTAGVPPQAS